MSSAVRFMRSIRHNADLIKLLVKRHILRDTDLSFTEFRMLVMMLGAVDGDGSEGLVADETGAVPVQDLIQCVGVEGSMVSRLLAKLARQGIVAVRRSGSGGAPNRHRNCKYVSLTATGRELADRLYAEYEDMSERLFSGVSDEARQAHLDVLNQVQAQIKDGFTGESSYGMLNARELIEAAFSGEDDAPLPERHHKRFHWTPPGPKARTKQGGPDDGEELPPDPNAPAAPVVDPLDDPANATTMSHDDLLAQGGLDRELRGDDVLDLFNRSKTYKGPNRAATAKGRAGLQGQVNRLRGYAGFGESRMRQLVDQLLDA